MRDDSAIDSSLSTAVKMIKIIAHLVKIILISVCV